jgi:hypothetical protein
MANKLQSGSDGKLRAKAGSGTAHGTPSIDVTFAGIVFADAPGWTKTCGDTGWVGRTVQMPVPDEPGYTYFSNYQDGTCFCTDVNYGLTSGIEFTADGSNPLVPAGTKSCCDQGVNVLFSGSNLQLLAGIQNCSGAHPPIFRLFSEFFNFVAWDCTTTQVIANSVTTAPAGGGYYNGTVTITPSTRRPLPYAHTFVNLGPLIGDCCTGDAPAP